MEFLIYFTTTMPYKGEYRRKVSHFAKFMNWKFNPNPPYNTKTTVQYPREQLLQITDEDVATWLTLQAYGKTNPGPTDYSKEKRHSSLLQYKKAISEFMINKRHEWDEVKHHGNPTRSEAVRKMLKKVEELEARKLGAKERKRRPFTGAEFEAVIQMIEEMLDDEAAFFAAAYFRYQFAMIARLDDTSKLRLDTLRRNEFCPDYAISSQICWSKNVKTAGDAPPQILFGCKDPNYCPLISLGTWLEYSLCEREIDTFVFEIDGCANMPDLEKAAAKIKRHASDILTKLVRSSEFKDMEILEDDQVGSHSIRKYASIKARRFGCPKDDVDYRARWKGKKRQQDEYCTDDVILPYPDAMVASALLNKDIIGYKVKAESGINDAWILKYVVPCIHRRFNRTGLREVALVLGKALLWRLFNDDPKYVPHVVKERVDEAYAELGAANTLEPGENPVERVPLIIHEDGRNEYCIMIEELEEGDDLVGGAAASEVVNALRYQNAQSQSLRRKQDELGNTVERHERKNAKRFKIMNNNQKAQTKELREIKELLKHRNNPIDEDSEDDDFMRGIDRNAKLGKVKTMHELWHEYQFGIGRNKPAKDFTPAERGKKKSTYCRRNHVWKLIAGLVNAGHTSVSVCDKIHEHYKGTMSSMMNQIRRDIHNKNLHPDLQISHL